LQAFFLVRDLSIVSALVSLAEATAAQVPDVPVRTPDIGKDLRFFGVAKRLPRK
jgi:hypothetical protein